MPEYPDITVYIEALERRVLGAELLAVRLTTPFLVRTVDPPLSAMNGRKVESLRRLGKRIAFGLSGDHWMVLHLMIAGRLHWKPQGVKLAGRRNLAAFDFDSGTLTLTEAGTRRQASLHCAASTTAMEAMNPGGLEVFESSLAQFRNALLSENHTLRRALTDPHLFSGIGNAYSDEILHRARLSPVAMSQKLSDAEVQRLRDAALEVLREWKDRLRTEANGEFPEGVTAFRPEMAVHGRYNLPCKVCGNTVQRIRFAANETDYCPHCQTGGRLLADRSLSRLLGSDWPKTPEELEMRKLG